MDECRKAYDEWCKERHLCDTTFAPWASERPSYAWEAWQAAWNYPNKQSETERHECGGTILYDSGVKYCTRCCWQEKPTKT